jgi:hypothetical protein
MSKLVKEMKALVAGLHADDRAEVLCALVGEWCPCCGEVLDEEGECCE